MKLHPYLNFGGNCAEAFKFYEKHLGGKITVLLPFSSAPADVPMPGHDPNQILHGHMTIGGTELMGSDVPQGKFQPMRSVYLSLSVDSIEEAEKIHALLSEGGQVFMPMEENFFAIRFSMLRDKFGVSWMINHSRPMPAK
jgi:PhnB protein